MIRALLVSALLLQGSSSEEASRLEQEAARILQERPAAAVDLLRRAVALREREEPADAEALGRTLNSLAYALSQGGREGEALTTGERALAVVRELGEPSPRTAAVRRNLAEIAARAGQLDRALGYAEEAARDMVAAYSLNPTGGEYYEFAGQLALQKGDPDRAMANLVQALGIYERFFSRTAPARLAGPLQGLALLFAGEGWFDVALDLHDRGLRALEAGGQLGSGLWAAHLDQRRQLLLALGELRLAGEDLARLAKTMAPRMRAADLAQARLAWAADLLRSGDPRRAREQLQQLDRAEVPPADPQWRGRRLLLEAQSLELEGRIEQALQVAARAREAFAATAPEGAEPVVPELEWLTSRCLRAAGKHEEAFDRLAALFRSERQAFGEDAGRLTPTYLELLAAELPAHGITPELIDLLDFADRAAARARPGELADLQNGTWTAFRRQAFEPLVRGWLHRLASEAGDGKGGKHLGEALPALDRARQRALLAANAWWIERGAAGREKALAEYLSALAMAPGPLPEEQDALRREVQAAAVALRRSGSVWADYLAPEGASLDAVRAALDEEQVLLSYHVCEGEVWALCLARNPEGDRLERLADRGKVQVTLRDALQSLADPARTTDLEDLAKVLLHPLWPALENARSVVLLADGPLAFLPFEALPDPDGQPWVLRASLRYAPTAAAWLQRPAAGSRGEGSVALVRGDAKELGAPWGNQIQRLRQRLPHSPASAPAQPLPSLDDCRLLFSEAALKQADREEVLQGPRLLEILAEAWIDGEVPSATAIVTAPGAEGEELSSWERQDGVLGLIECRDLTLDVGTAVLWRARVLGGGWRHEGLHELVASLWAAGSRDVLVSGWLPDAAAAEFDAGLRAALAKGPAAEALTATQRRWLRQHRGDPARLDPGVWARLRFFGR